MTSSTDGVAAYSGPRCVVSLRGLRTLLTSKPPVRFAAPDIAPAVPRRLEAAVTCPWS